MECRICKNEDLKIFLSLGKSPLANSFLAEEDLNKEEKKYPLELVFCSNCKLVQLSYVVDPELMFKNYVYVTSTTKTFQRHFTQMAEEIGNKFNLTEKSLVVDIGSNDGLLLKGFQKFKKVRVMGVEPATNIAKMANDSGIDTINDFFSEKTVDEIIEKKKCKADVVTANNVFAHINDIDEVIKNVKLLLKENGIFVIEVQYFVDTIEQMTFDNVYHEHLSYYTLTSLKNFFNKHNLEIFNVQKVDSHGGSLRVFIMKNGGKQEIQEEVGKMLDYESERGVGNINTYNQFAEKVYGVKKQLIVCLKKVKSQNKSIAGYGAPAKSTTLLNFCNIGKEIIDYIVEDNSLKIGLFTPGTHIPLESSKNLDENKPDYILILAWNFASEILNKTIKYSQDGVKFIIPLPELKIV